LAARDALQVQPDDTFLGWQFPLHNCEAYGLIDRINRFRRGNHPRAALHQP